MTHKIEMNELLETMFSKDGINFENAYGWNLLARQVRVHNEELNESLGFNVTEDEALFSWYENIYTPVKRAIASRRVRKSFQDKSTGEIFIEVAEHWKELAQKNDAISAEVAAYDLSYRNKKKNGRFTGMMNSQKPRGGMPTVGQSLA
ncbi:MAG: hypothetical protein PQJ46_16085 [Spirochaetales bacterium]|nr:hypothetical protein [Spirochaetales bacterium]